MKKYNLIIPILIIFLAIQCSSEMEEDIQQVDTTTATISDSDGNSSDNSSSSDNSQTDDTPSFNHKNMLINWVDNIIVPSLDNFNLSLTVLKESTETFVNAPASETFSKVKEDWLASFLKSQHVEMFDIGLAEEIYYKNRVNLYPANVNKIESNISNQNYDLDESVNFSSQGFNSIDYLYLELEKMRKK